MMNSTRFTLGRQAFLVIALAMLVLGSLPVAPAGAQPISDHREVKVKVKDFKLDCEWTGGTVRTRPSATDADKTIANCDGGLLDGSYCVYTPTTSDCGVTRGEENDASGKPDQTGVTDLAPTDTHGAATSVDQADGQGQHVTGSSSSDDHSGDHQLQKGKKRGKHGKHGKGRR